jgi:hypothetical protein
MRGTDSLLGRIAEHNAPLRSVLETVRSIGKWAAVAGAGIGMILSGRSDESVRVFSAAVREGLGVKGFYSPEEEEDQRRAESAGYISPKGGFAESMIDRWIKPMMDPRTRMGALGAGGMYPVGDNIYKAYDKSRAATIPMQGTSPYVLKPTTVNIPITFNNLPSNVPPDEIKQIIKQTVDRRLEESWQGIDAQFTPAQ